MPGTYTLKLIIDGTVLTQKIAVKLDPRFKLTPDEIADAHRLALTIRGEISRVSEIVIALQSVRKQLNERAELSKDNAKAADWIKEAKSMVERLDRLEAELHNPKAKVTYDILAMKGGAKLYSQLAPLYDTVKDSDGPVTQGMREVHAGNAKELDRLAGEWRALGAGIARLNDIARTLGLPIVVTPDFSKELERE